MVDETCKTSLESVYVDKDIVLSDATVITTMDQGRIAGAAMNHLAKKKRSQINRD